MSSTSRCVPERDAPLVFLGVLGVRPKPGRTGTHSPVMSHAQWDQAASRLGTRPDEEATARGASRRSMPKAWNGRTLRARKTDE